MFNSMTLIRDELGDLKSLMKKQDESVEVVGAGELEPFPEDDEELGDYAHD